MINTQNDLSSSIRVAVGEKLQPILALFIDLKLQAKYAHWNVRGENFFSLHELFDKLAADADEYADEIAERVVQLGGVAEGLLKRVSHATQLPEYPAGLSEQEAHLQALTTSLAYVAKICRAAIDGLDQIGDKDSADLMTGISRGVDKWLWMVEAHTARTPQK